MLLKFHKLFDALTKNERQIFEGALMVFLVAFVLNGINLFYKTTTIRPIAGGIFNEGVVGQPTNLNPILSSNNEADRDLIEFLFLDAGSMLKEYRISNNGKTWDLEMKEGMKWSDGEKIDGDDLIFTLKAIQNPETRSPMFPAWDGVIAEKINDLEVKINLKTPYAFFLDNLKNLKLIPEHIFGKIPLSNIRLSDFNLEPISSGPFAFKEYTKRKDGFIKEYSFSENLNFNGQHPLIKEFNFVFFADIREAIEAFNKKEINGLGGLTPDQEQAIEISHELNELKLPRYYSLFLNPSTFTPFQDKEVRRAIDLAIDKSRIIKEVFLGKATEVDGPIMPGMEGYKPGQVVFDVEQAKDILAKNSWKTGEEGILEKVSGGNVVQLKFEMVVPNIDFLKKTADIIKENLMAVGIFANIKLLEPQEVTSQVIKQRSYEGLLFGSVLKSNPDIISFWHSLERFYPGLNLSLYENKSLDETLESARKNLNKNSRIKEVKKIQEIIRNDKPSIFLYSPNYLYVTSNDLKGFRTKLMIGYPSKRLSDVSEWNLKTARVFK